MAGDMPDRSAEAWQARCLLRAARQATLATQHDGQPYAALVTPATSPDLSILLFLSSLSEHTRHLLAEPRCALFVAGAAEEANPQTAPRVTVTGRAEQIDDPAQLGALKSRWLAIHPYAAMYAEFRDFALWRVRPQAASFVGGFARAARLGAAALLPEPAAAAELARAEAGIVEHCNSDHADAMAELAGAPGAWRMVTADTDGCDLAQGETVRRIAWSAPVADAAGVRKELIALLRTQRLPRG